MEIMCFSKKSNHPLFHTLVSPLSFFSGAATRGVSKGTLPPRIPSLLRQGRSREERSGESNIKFSGEKTRLSLSRLGSLSLSRFSLSVSLRVSTALLQFPFFFLLLPSVPAHKLELVVLERADRVRVDSGKEPPPLGGVPQQGGASLALLPVERDVP